MFKFTNDDIKSMDWYFEVYKYFFSRCSQLVEFETMTLEEKTKLRNQSAIDLTKIYCSSFEFSDDDNN